ncbi:bacteriohemerythrin [Hydrogenophaga sp.]|uniref:bacteriohemerythrin n=1 Tax=Hydrogenophaga sp. TaxID=1904254 RepID=UPI003D0AEE1A
MDIAEWSDALRLDFDPLDALNRKLIEDLARAQRAGNDDLLLAWGELVAHVTTHFGQEDRWMRTTGHGQSEAHALEHRVVLNLLREGLAQARNGQLAPARQMARELGAWFLRHTQSFDAALALHLRSHTPA